MLRPSSSTALIQQKPRKLLKLQILKDKNYNQFQGNSDFEGQEKDNATRNQNTEGYNSKQQKETKKQSIEQQINSYEKIYELIAKQNLKFKKVQVDVNINVENQKEGAKRQKEVRNKNPEVQRNSKLTKKQLKEQKVEQKKNSVQDNRFKVKLQEGQEIKAESSRKDMNNQQLNENINTKENNKQQKNKKNLINGLSQKSKTQTQPSSNWKKFLQQSKDKQTHNHKNSTNSQNKNPLTNQKSQFIALDCQFVKSGQEQHLARISIVSQSGQTLYDSYIKPQKKVTQFLTQITGITYSHIKNAPLWKDQIAKVKKILLGKILIGHTLDKDLEVTGLTNWKGVSNKVDVSQFLEYKQKGGSKVVSLKRLSASFLNRNIQLGWHSSVEDAVATMDLFKINKKKILKQLKMISK